MKRAVLNVGFLVGAVVLSGCGGASVVAPVASFTPSTTTTSSGGSSGGSGSSDERTLQDALRGAEQLLAEVALLDFSQASDIPLSGSASYEGYIVADSPGLDNGFIGDLAMSVDFGTSAITGTASNFLDEAETNYSGTLNVSNGSINRTANPATDFQFAADLDGVISGGGQDYTFDSDLRGSFVGTNQDAMLGEVGGTISNGTLGTVAIDEDLSAFVAKQ